MNIKIYMQSFPQQSERKSENVLDLIHTDVRGLFNVPSIDGSRYFLTFIDDKPRKMFVYFIKAKSEVLDKFKAVKIMVERQTGKLMRALRSDNDREFINNAFNKYLK